MESLLGLEDIKRTRLIVKKAGKPGRERVLQQRYDAS
jgi:cohesin loading factor subunit SCC2